jgi:hypothetical protein
VFAAPAQVACPLEAVEGRAEGALAVRELLGQRFYGDVGAAGEPVDVRGDGCFAGREVSEVVRRAGELVRGVAFSVTRIGHRVWEGVRGEEGSTKLGVSHGIGS